MSYLSLNAFCWTDCRYDLAPTCHSWPSGFWIYPDDPPIGAPFAFVNDCWTNMLSGNGGEAFNCLYKYGYQMTRTVVNKYLTELYCVYAKEREEKRKHIVIWVPFRTKLMFNAFVKDQRVKRRSLRINGKGHRKWICPPDVVSLRKDGIPLS